MGPARRARPRPLCFGCALLIGACAAAKSESSQPAASAADRGAPAGTSATTTAVQAGAAGRTGAAGSVAANAGTTSKAGAGAPAGANAGASAAAGATSQAGGAGAIAVAGAGAQAAGASSASGAGASAAAGTAAAGAGAAGAGATLPPCPASNYAAGEHREMLQHQSRARHYTVYVPSTIAAGERVPLVLDFHGNGSSGAQEASGSGWRQKADREQFLVAYPDGVGNGWNVGNCCGEALSGNVDDVGFAKAIVQAVSAAACVDPKRVYATGISNGAGLAHRLGCEAADVFAAIAAASADLVTDPCTPARPISELSVRGLDDTLVNYAGGNTGSTGWYSPGAKKTLELWRTIDGCSEMSETVLRYCQTYQECKAGVEASLCSLPGTGHILYNNALGFSVPDVAWDMFKRQPMP